MKPEINLALFASKIKEKRGDMTYVAAAAKIGTAGVSPGTIARCESQRLPDLNTYIRICRWLDLPTDTFVIKKIRVNPAASKMEPIGAVTNMQLANKLQQGFLETERQVKEQRMQEGTEDLFSMTGDFFPDEERGLVNILKQYEEPEDQQTKYCEGLDNFIARTQEPNRYATLITEDGTKEVDITLPSDQEPPYTMAINPEGEDEKVPIQMSDEDKEWIKSQAKTEPRQVFNDIIDKGIGVYKEAGIDAGGPPESDATAIIDHSYGVPEELDNPKTEQP